MAVKRKDPNMSIPNMSTPTQTIASTADLQQPNISTQPFTVAPTADLQRANQNQTTVQQNEEFKRTASGEAAPITASNAGEFATNFVGLGIPGLAKNVALKELKVAAGITGKELLSEGLKAVAKEKTMKAGQNVALSYIKALSKGNRINKMALENGYRATGEGTFTKIGEIEKITMNAKNAFTLKKFIAGKGLIYGAAGIAFAVLSDAVFSRFEGAELHDVVDGTYRRAVASGDQTLIDQAYKDREDANNFIKDNAHELPFKKSFAILDRRTESEDRGLAIDKAINEIKLSGGEENLTSNLMEYQKEKAKIEKTTREDYNNERKLQVAWEQQARREGDIAAAKFWADEKTKSFNQERKERDANGEYWLNFRKRIIELNLMSQQNQTQNRASGAASQSKLNFGLLK